MSAAPVFSEDTSIQRYFADEEISPTRHEYTAGILHDMGGASSAHNTIAGNIFAALHAHVRERHWEIFISDMKVRVKMAGADLFYYPDVMICCDPSDDAVYFRHSPCVIFEIMSDTTERLDRGEKFVAYRTIASLQHYVLVRQDRVYVTTFHRRNDFMPEVCTRDTDLIAVDPVQFNLTLGGIYAHVRF
ncbi:MAG: Uma2 family endonuclease [Verrucomicrobiota bacterium]